MYTNNQKSVFIKILWPWNFVTLEHRIFGDTDIYADLQEFYRVPDIKLLSADLKIKKK